MDKLFILTGPTGVGKTEISIKLAKQLNGEIISADSMQIYKYMDIGSAKISNEEMQGVRHHLIDIIDPKESFTVADFKEKSAELIKDISSRGKLPMLVGGTGLYIDSLIKNYSFTEANKNESYRVELERIAEEKGKEYVHEFLKDIDKISYDKIHFNNLKRVIRALEVVKLTGKPFSQYKIEDSYTGSYDLNYFVLSMNRDKLYKRINKRVDIMLEKGLINEVEKLKAMNLTSDMQSMKGIGYKEILDYLNNKISYDYAIQSIKQGSRNYAKRQLTWFRRNDLCQWIDKDIFDSEESIVKYIINKTTLCN